MPPSEYSIAVNNNNNNNNYSFNSIRNLLEVLYITIANSQRRVVLIFCFFYFKDCRGRPLSNPHVDDITSM